MKIGCIVLAAGKSTRFGKEDKLLQPLGGSPLLLCTLSALPVNLFEAFCVVTSSDSVSKLCADHGYPCVKYSGGLLSDSIREGLRAMPEGLDGFLFVNGDRPFLTTTTIKHILASFVKNPECVIRLYSGENPSNPVMFPVSAKDALFSLRGDQGGSRLIKSGKYGMIPVQAASESEVFDIDDQSTLAQANRILQSSSVKE